MSRFLKCVCGCMPRVSINENECVAICVCGRTEIGTIKSCPRKWNRKTAKLLQEKKLRERDYRLEIEQEERGREIRTCFNNHQPGISKRLNNYDAVMMV